MIKAKAVNVTLEPESFYYNGKERVVTYKRVILPNTVNLVYDRNFYLTEFGSQRLFAVISGFLNGVLDRAQLAMINSSVQAVLEELMMTREISLFPGEGFPYSVHKDPLFEMY